MAPIRVKWDPEILAGGFHPSSIFDEVEAINITAPVTTMAPVLDLVDRVVALAINTTVSAITTTPVTITVPTISAPVDPVGVQSAAASVNPAHRITGVLSPADNTTSGLTILVEEVARRVADLATSFSTTPTPTTVERVTMTPKVAVEHVSIKKKF